MNVQTDVECTHSEVTRARWGKDPRTENRESSARVVGLDGAHTSIR